MLANLSQRLVIQARLGRIMTLAYWRSGGMERMIAPVLQQPYHIVLMTVHFSIVVTLVGIHTC
jgi:hypothetical protein